MPPAMLRWCRGHPADVTWLSRRTHGGGAAPLAQHRHADGGHVRRRLGGCRSNGDFVVIGHNQDSHGRPIANTMLEYDSNGTLLWRVDFTASFFPAVARLDVDAAGNAYLAWSAVGSGLFVQKYSPAGTLLWSQADSTIGGGYAIASSLALSPDGADVAVTGSVSGGATWITAVYDATTGVRRWQATAGEGTAAKGVVVDASRVYVTGRGARSGHARARVAPHRGRLRPGDRSAAMAQGQEAGRCLRRRWSLDGPGAGREPGRDRPDESWVPRLVPGCVRDHGNGSMGGRSRWWIEHGRDSGGHLGAGRRHNRGDWKRRSQPSGRSIPGVTGGYSSNGELRWEAFSRMATVWATSLPEWRRMCRGGYDAFITCWRVSGTATAVMSAVPSTGVAPLLVSFDGSGSTTPNGR